MKSELHVLAHVQRELKKLADENIAFLAASRADSFDEYKKVCGVIRGLSLADSIINDLVQKMESSDDD
jgi:rRNA-processing protein FCF1